MNLCVYSSNIVYVLLKILHFKSYASNKKLSPYIFNVQVNFLIICKKWERTCKEITFYLAHTCIYLHQMVFQIKCFHGLYLSATMVVGLQIQSLKYNNKSDKKLITS